MKDKYGKTVVNITPLDGYIDANFKIDIVDGISDGHSGYETVILKISSGSTDSISMLGVLFANYFKKCLLDFFK
jgi:hypothetical protein